MGISFYFDWEVALIEYLQAHLPPFFIKLFSFITLFGEETALIAVLGFLYWCWDKKMGKNIGFNIIAAVIFNPMLKNSIPRRRPYVDKESIACLKPVDADADIYDLNAQGFSFPSGHSTSSAATFGSIALFLRKKWATVLAFVLPLFVGVSRFVLGVHYPTDVLAGWAMGAAIALLASFLQRKVQRKWILYIGLFVCAIPGWFYCTSSDFYSSFGLMVGFFAASAFEEKYVKFENTRCVLCMILRLAGGFALFFGLNTVLKLPFSSAFLDSGTFLAHLVRTLRYAVVIFADMALYPMLFRLDKRFGRK